MEDYILLFLLFLALMLVFFVVFVILQKANQTYLIKEWQRQSDNKEKSELLELKTYIVKEMSEMKDKVNQDLQTFQSGMSNAVKEDFHQLRESTTQRLSSIESKVNESMEKGFRTTYESFSKVLEQMARIDNTQKNLDQLSIQIASLQSVLTDKKHRGTFGEVELYSLLEMQFGVNEQRYQKQYKLRSGKIADAVLFGPKPLGMIAIDSKFPLENYNRMYDSNLMKEQQEQARTMFRQDVLIKIKEIASKYIVEGETASFAYMFIPAEAVFAEIYGRFDDIIRYSYEAHVYLVSPTTLMAYLTAIQAIYLGQQRNEKMDLIAEEFIRLGKEFARFETRWDKLGSDMKRVHTDFNDLSITTGKLMQRFKNVESLQLLESKEVENNKKEVNEKTKEADYA